MVCGDGTREPGCNEECDDGNQDAGDGCSPTCLVEPGLGCTAEPQSGCRAPFVPHKASIQLYNKSVDTKDAIKWKWSKGNRTTLADLGSPTTTTSYQVCIYDQTGLRFEITHPADGTCAGRPCWKPTGTHGFSYKDKELTPDGGRSLKLREGAIGKAQIQFQGRGPALAMPNLNTLVHPLVVQIQNSDGLCWEARYSGTPLKQTAEQFKAVAD
jgi:cysteine-rich repeat protein